MALSSLVEFVILVVKNPCYQQDDASSSIQEISISASEIASWDMSEILSYGSVKVRAHRTRQAYSGILVFPWPSKRKLQMLVKSDKYFGNVPYELLMWCVKHPHLTVHSEMDLVDGLLIWLDAGGRLSDLPESSQDNTINLMEQVRFSLLPLWFIAGRSKSHGFSKFADQSIELVTKLMKMPSTCLVDSLTDGPPTDVRVRLTEYSEILDLSGCPQLNEASLLLSILPNSYFANLRWRKSLESFLKNPDDDERHQEQISHRTLPILSFESVKEIDISKCQRLDYKVVIKCFSKSFPSLRKLRAAYLLNIKVSTLLELLLNFRELTEVDLTVDVSPIIPVQASVFYSGQVCYTSFSENSILALCATISMTNEHMDINSVASNLQTLHMSKCEGISETSLLNLITHSQKMKSLCLRDTKVSDSVLCEFPGSTLEALDISNTTEISDSALTSVLTSLKHLQELALSYCFGEISLQSFKFSMPNLRKLRLERVTRWMTNDDLLVLTQSCPNLTELSLECGSITENGVASLYGCIALEDLFLRHNGSGIQKSFLLDATLKRFFCLIHLNNEQFPMLRLVSLDMCDAKEGGFDVPEVSNT
nr:hypothetical protein At2g36370 [imported] - Arabidopsis thaliana [Arabidopsis thaliana]